MNGVGGIRTSKWWSTTPCKCKAGKTINLVGVDIYFPLLV